MAVLAADLTFPTGEIQPQWFEGQDVAAYLSAWIGLGGAQVPAGATPEQSDAIVGAYSYWRAYTAIHLRLAGDPNSVALSGELSASWSAANIEAFSIRATFWYKRFLEAVEGAAEAVPVEATRTPMGGPMPVVYVF